MYFLKLLFTVLSCFSSKAKVPPVPPKDAPPVSPRLPELGRRPVMSIDPARSKAIGALYEAISLKLQKVERTEEQKAIIDQRVYQACVRCYANNVSRAEIGQIIKAVSAEYKEPVK